MIVGRDLESGFTLVEFAIVAAMSALVVFTLATFYINAQHMWLDSSLQAVSQRDASMFVELIAEQAALADDADLPDPSHLHFLLKGTQRSSITWDPSQKRALLTIYNSNGKPPSKSWWPTNGEVASLKFSIPVGLPRVITLDSLIVVTSPGEVVFLSTTCPLLNRP